MTLLLLLLLTLATVAKGSRICDSCKCQLDSIVDCTDLGLENHFNASDWNDTLKDIGVQTVLFNNNEIVHVTPFPALPLVKLSFCHNRIARIDDMAFRDLQNLTELDLSHNHLTSDILTPLVFKGHYAEDSFEPLRMLKILRLGSNALHSLHPDLFEHLPNLEELSLDSNPFTVLDRVTVFAIATPAYLRVLDLSYTNIQDLPDHMLHTPRFLEELSLTGNRFTRVPKGLAEAIHLKTLNLDNNPIRSITVNRPFPEMPELTSLRLSWMANLTTIEAGAMGGLPKLQELICSHNQLLRKIDSAAFSRINEGDEGRTWPPITKLELNNNHLGYLDSALIARWDQVELLNLQMNPWVCDCENQWLVSTLAKIIEVNHPEYMKDFTCEEPIEMRGKSIAQMESTEYQMRCLDTAGNRPEKDGRVLIGVLIATLLGVPVILVCTLICRRYRYILPSVGPRGPADYSRAFYSRADHNEEI